MRFHKIDLRSYAHFINEYITFSADRNLHFIYGSNEAGKSSFTRAVKSLLFGIEKNSTDDFLHGDHLYLEALLQSSNGKHLNIIREKKLSRKLNLELKNFYPQISKENFSNYYCLNANTIRMGSEDLLRNKNDFGLSLFTIASNVPQMQKILVSTNQDLQKIFKLKGKNPKLNQLLNKYKEMQEKESVLRISPNEYQEIENEIKIIQNQKSAIDLQLEASSVSIQKLEFLRILWDSLSKYEFLKEEIAKGAHLNLLEKSYFEEKASYDIALSTLKHLKSHLERMHHVIDQMIEEESMDQLIEFTGLQHTYSNIISKIESINSSLLPNNNLTEEGQIIFQLIERHKTMLQKMDFLTAQERKLNTSLSEVRVALRENTVAGSSYLKLNEIQKLLDEQKKLKSVKQSLEKKMDSLNSEIKKSEGELSGHEYRWDSNEELRALSIEIDRKGQKLESSWKEKTKDQLFDQLLSYRKEILNLQTFIKSLLDPKNPHLLAQGIINRIHFYHEQLQSNKTELSQVEEKLQIIDRNQEIYCNHFKVEDKTLEKLFSYLSDKRNLEKTLQQEEKRLLSAIKELSIEKKQVSEFLKLIKKEWIRINKGYQSQLFYLTNKEKNREEVNRAFLKGFKVTSDEELKTLEELSRAYHENSHQLDNLREELSCRCKPKTLEYYLNEKKELHKDQFLEELKEKKEAFIEQKKELSVLDQALGTLNYKLKRLLKREESVELEIEMQKAMAQIHEQVENYLAHKLLTLILEETILEFQSRYKDPILSRAGEVFKELTCKAYERVELNLLNKNQSTLTCINRKNQKVNVDQLSDGTRDQLFLALKIAVIEASLDHVEPFPLIMDDLFINFDDRRAQRGLMVLEELSKKNQIIFLSHHNHLLNLASSCLDPQNFEVYHLKEKAPSTHLSHQ